MTDKIQGSDELIDNLKKLGSNLSGALEAAATSGAMLIQNEAKDLAPYRTGTLRRSIHTETVEKTSDSVTLKVGTDVVYAAAQEFGIDDRNLPAHPFLRPAVDHNKEKLVDEIRKALSSIVKGAI